MANSNLSPFVFWAQNESRIFIKVDLRDTSKHSINIESKRIYFTATGRGARGLHHYQFELKLYESIDPKECNYNILPSHVIINLTKRANRFWPRLIKALNKPAWLKVDFDKWVSDDGSAEIDENVPNILEQYPDIFNQLQKDEKGYRTESFKKVYLVLYNLFQFVGFLYILIVMGLRYAEDNTRGVLDTYKSVGTAMKLCTLFQWLEVCHPLFGYTKNKVLPCFLQVAGRSLILFVMIESEERMQTKPVVFYLFLVWSLIEIVRYPYYITQLNKFEIGFLTWLRYTLWVPLYPLGIFCEGVTILRDIPYFEETQRFSISMPNEWNFVFWMPFFMKTYLFILFFPAMYIMMRHMYWDRVKKLSPKKKYV